MAGIISTITNGILTGRLHRGVMADPVPDYVIPGARSEMLPSNALLVVSVASGTCVIGGCVVDFPTIEQVTISPVTGQKGYIVARLNLTAGTATIIQIQGTTPTINAANLVNADTGIRDLVLAYYTTSATAITSFTDARALGKKTARSLWSTVPASTSDKGIFPGQLAVGEIVELSMDKGNTSASPTITIGGTKYTIYYMPTVAKTANSAFQVYRLLKTDVNTLSCPTVPDYKCEYGWDAVSSNVDDYERWISGKAILNVVATVGLTSSGAFGSGGLYIQNGTFEIQAGYFKEKPRLWVNHPAASSVYGSCFGYATSEIAGGVQIIKNNSAATTVNENIFAVGIWK